MTQGQSFNDYFQQCFNRLGQQVLKQYGQTVEIYKKHIIPFQKSRMKSSQNLAIRNSSLQHDKIQLQRKLDKIMTQNHQLQYSLQTQSSKIHEIQRYVESLQKVNNDNQKTIQTLKNMIVQLQQSLNLKTQTIKQVQQDKQKALQNCQKSKNQFNLLLSDYMKYKNQLADKLNYMNEYELKLIEKENQIKSQQFYLKKQWEEFQQSKKNEKTPIKSIIPQRSLNRKPIFNEQSDIYKQQEVKKNDKNEILKTPMKKIYKHHQNEIYSLSFNYNGNIIASCAGDRLIKIYDVQNMRSGVTIHSNSAQSIYTSCSLNYGGQFILSGLTDKTVQIHQTHSGKQIHSFLGHGQKVNSVTWSCSREKCISGSDDRQIKIWEIQKAANLFSINTGKAVKVINSNSVQPVVYSGHSDGSVRIYSITQGTSPIAQIKGIIDYPIRSISMLSNRYQILVTDQQGTTINLIDLKANKSIAKYDNKDFFNAQAQADMSPSQVYVVAGNCDGQVYYWNKDKKIVQKKVSGHDSAITALKYHFISSVLATADNGGSMILWQ